MPWAGSQSIADLPIPLEAIANPVLDRGGEEQSSGELPERVRTEYSAAFHGRPGEFLVYRFLP